jgi:hypothetical protein
MEQGEPKKAFECFEAAISHNPEDPDIYYHRGQGMYYLPYSRERLIPRSHQLTYIVL